MNKQDLKKILDNHLFWLSGHNEWSRADLSGANLSKANLCGANLSGANLPGANLCEANLHAADLSEAYLSGANLSKAILSGANLYRAGLCGANLSKANLCGANLSGANLYRADLSGADLSKAILSGADLSGADLSGAILPPNSIVPEIGPFYCFKKLKSGAIALLYVPRSAKRLGGLRSRKCRVSKAKVISISRDNTPITSDYDKHSGKLKYEAGKWVKPDKFNEDIRLDCTNGIHVFMTKKEAEEY